MTFGEWLDGELKARGLSQTDLEHMVGSDSTNIGKWRSGKVIPSPRYCNKLAEAFGVSPDFVFRMAGHYPAMDEVQKEDMDFQVQRLELKRDVDAAIDYFEALITRLRSQSSVLGRSQESPKSSTHVDGEEGPQGTLPTIRRSRKPLFTPELRLTGAASQTTVRA